ncbi:MAG: hypothetical protein IPL53_06700 [Ignavibacteria bacterium]|nr:hypothetical protein [Ignavibacteria bacterium]
MNEEKDFIIEKIKEIICQFSNVRIEYEYNEESLIHFIKVEPLEIYETKDFKKCAVRYYLNILTNTLAPFASYQKMIP